MIATTVTIVAVEYKTMSSVLIDIWVDILEE